MDDTMLFGATTKKEARWFKCILEKYSITSSQEASKENLFFFFNTSIGRENQILCILKFHKGKLPCKYFCFPLAKGVLPGKLWDPLVEKVKTKLAS